MRNRISCSAQELNQLDPDMVESVVGGAVFKIGNQYYSDNRVNVIEANASQIVSEVNGTYGVYSQTIKLRGGALSTKCSCPSTEQPFCRHCVAVLLYQYHNGEESNGTAPPKSKPTSSAPPTSSAQDSSGTGGNASSSSSVDLNFREATLFIDWIQQAMAGLGQQPSLAPVPESLGGVAREWAGVIDRLNQQFLESEEDRTEAQQALREAESRIESLSKDLESVKGEAQSAQSTCQELGKKVTSLEASLSEFSTVSQERDRLVKKVSGMQSELHKKGAELESVSMTLKSLSNAIRNLLPSDPSK